MESLQHRNRNERMNGWTESNFPLQGLTTLEIIIDNLMVCRTPKHAFPRSLNDKENTEFQLEWSCKKKRVKCNNFRDVQFTRHHALSFISWSLFSFCIWHWNETGEKIEHFCGSKTASDLSCHVILSFTTRIFELCSSLLHLRTECHTLNLNCHANEMECLNEIYDIMKSNLRALECNRTIRKRHHGIQI